MANFSFRKATKQQRKARIALIGPSGSGKTYSALAIASGMGNNIAVIDTENHSSTLYADTFDFSVLSLETFAPQTYCEAIRAAEAAGFDVLIIDSLSHAWMGKDGALEQVDKAAARSRSGNSFAAWREVTPKHNELVDTMIRCNCHLLVTMRAKTEYVIEQVERGGKTVSTPRKIGMAPVQRDGLEYEFDLVADMDLDNNLIVSKTRFPWLNGEVINKPAAEVGQQIADWLADGDPAPERQAKREKVAQKKVAQEPVDDDKIRKRFFAETNKLNVPADIAKDWAKTVLHEAESFNDVPADKLQQTIDAIGNAKRAKDFVEQVRSWYRGIVLASAAELCGDLENAENWLKTHIEKEPAEATLAELQSFAEAVEEDIPF